MREGVLQESPLIDLYQGFMPDQRTPECHGMEGDARKQEEKQFSRRTQGWEGTAERKAPTAAPAATGIASSRSQGSHQRGESSL